ncbi:MAG: ribosome maturation factor RimP [Candidatus Eremiobacteraeota bacterium]|nr:ribosome maturation factor RimP [Candidatus Eremiobacteraeota bacterium]
MADLISTFERVADELERTHGSALGVEIVSTSAHRRRGGVDLRVVIDKPGGVDVATCERISRRLNEALESYPDPYTLSVESAGLERPLVRPSDYERFVGSNVKLTTSLTICGAKTHRGKLAGVRGTNVVLEQPSGELPIPLSVIKHAKLEYDFRADLTKEKQERRRKP